MKVNFNLRREIKISVALIGLLALISFSERKQGAVVCKNIVVEMQNVNGNYYLDEADVMRLVEESGQTLKGSAIGLINLKQIESKLRYDKHVREAELFGDLKGNLLVQVELRRPIARLIDDEGPDAYISEEGVVMGVSEKFTSRVTLITGNYVKHIIESGDLNKSEEGQSLMAMIEYINDDPFWKAQVAQMDINSKGEITIYPQITGQLVEFGTTANFQEKFEKLMVFYKEILPQKGWTRYERVNLKYDGQVIAE